MHPYIRFFMFRIPVYSLMILLGAMAFTFVSICLLEKKEKVVQRITNRLLLLSVAGFAAMGGGALLLNSLFHSIEKGTVTVGGITWLGGVLCAFPIMILLIHVGCPYVKGEALDYFNLLMPGIVLAHGIGRLGCFFGGCCFGARTDGPLGVRFPEGSPAALAFPAPTGGSLPVLPTQLFEACFEGVLFILMLVLYRWCKKHFVEIYAIGYGLFRFLLEFVRGDDRGQTGVVITPSQLMSVLLMVGGVCLLLYHKGILAKKLRSRMRQYAENRDPCETVLNTPALACLRAVNRLSAGGVISDDEANDLRKRIIRKHESAPLPRK